jgi:ATP-dependent RNA helicase RhlE
VVNYELPNVPEDYVHRIGRTGRAGSGGEAISLVSSDEGSLLRDIERVLRRPIPMLPTPEFRIVESAPVAASANRPARHVHGNRGGERRDVRRGGHMPSRGRGQPQRGRFN